MNNGNRNTPARRNTNETKPATQDTSKAGPISLVKLNHAHLRLRDDLHTNKGLLQALMRSTKQSIDSFLADVFVAVSKNPDLLHADRLSLMYALGEAAAMGWSVNPDVGECWLIARWNKKVQAKTVSMQAGYKGLHKLMLRSGMVDWFDNDVVYRGESFIVRRGSDPVLIHEPNYTDPTVRTNKFDDIIAAHMTVMIKGGSKPVFAVASRARLEMAVAKSGKSKDEEVSTFWRDHPEVMSLKTGIRVFARTAPREDGLRDFHEAVRRDGVREGGEEPEPLTEDFEKFKVSAAPPTGLGERVALEESVGGPSGESIDVESSESAAE